MNNGTLPVPSSSVSEHASTSTKRSRSHSSEAEDTSAPNSAAASIQAFESGFWSGWAELENDPAIFTTLLREWGVPNVQVNEVVQLDTIFDAPPDAIFGLIFLSQWAPAETENEIIEPPENVWFANQTSSFSCATVSIMNIINNCSGLDLGWRLNEFKHSTKDRSPKDRGIALDQFEHIKAVHNSFATQIDKLNVDLRLQEDVAADAKKKKAAAAATAAEAKGQKRRKQRKKVSAEEGQDDHGFHFISYVPAANQIWRMDGMEAMPRKLGSFTTGESWLMMVLSELQSQIDTAMANGLECSMLSLTPTSDTSSTAADEQRMNRTREDWHPFIAHMIQLHAEKGDLKSLVA